jgi:siderophore synthetase component
VPRPEEPRDRPRTPAERRVHPAAVHLARVHDLAEPPSAAYRRVLPRARGLTRERLVRGLLRGQPEGLPDPSVVPHPARDGAGEPSVPAALRERLPDDPEAVGLVPLGDAGLLAAPLETVRGFARHDVGRPVLHADGGIEADPHPVDVVDAVAETGGFPHRHQDERIRAEVDEGVAYLALALLAEDVQARNVPDGPLLDADPAALPAADRDAYMERLVTRGHPYHPAAKIRRGMDLSSVLAYDPAFAGRVPLRFAAVDGDMVKGVTAAKEGPCLSERVLATFPGLEAAAAQALPDGDALEDRVVVPVHPWQFHQVLPRRYGAAIRDGTVVPVPGYEHPATPLVNVRTVVPHRPDDAPAPPPHVKLPLGVQLTNVERTLSPQAVHNGPEVTRLLRALLGGTQSGSVGVLGEVAAAGVHPPGGPHVEGEGFDRARHLGALLRRNPRTHPLVPAEGTVVPASSLAARRAGGRPVLEEVLARYGETTAAGDPPSAAARGFLADLAEAVVPDHLDLLVRDGVALEAHLQNSLLVLEEGRPEAVLVRDLGGIRVHHGRVRDRGHALDSYPGSDLDADGARDLHRKLYYTLFQNHLAEVVAGLTEAAPVAEDRLWTEVADVASRAFDDLLSDPAVPDERVRRDREALFADPCEHKAITAMRLEGKRHEYVVSEVPNPLAGAGSALP